MTSTADETRTESRSDLSAAVLVGAVLSLFGAPLLGRVDRLRYVDPSTTSSMLANSLVSWLVAGVLLALVVFWEGRGLTSIGLRAPTRAEAALGLGAGFGGVVFGLLVTGIAVLSLNLEQPETLSAISRLSRPVRLAVVGTAVVTEEVLWRGYPAWGLVGAIPQAVFTLVLLWVYVRSRNVVACMLAHGVINLLMIFALPAFL
jgi:membrane protease YdiL (CAAX protease family)